jgi:hypothetical protein
MTLAVCISSEHNQIAAHPGHGVCEKPSFDTLTAVMEYERSCPYVVKSVDTAIHLASPFDAIGIGPDLARYIGCKLFRKGLTDDQATTLAAFILEEAKENIVACGGLSQIIWIGRAGLKGVSSSKMEELRLWFSQLHGKLPDLNKIPSKICPILESRITVTREE